MVKISGAYGKLKAWVTTQIAVHKALADAHHTKYTDAEAVSAVDTADEYVKNTGDIMTGDLTVRQTNEMQIYARASDTWDIGGFYLADKVASPTQYWKMLARDRNNATQQSLLKFSFYNGSSWIPMLALDPINFTIDFGNRILKDPKNCGASALSGTKKLVEIDISGTTYYYEVYPTKA